MASGHGIGKDPDDQGLAVAPKSVTVFCVVLSFEVNVFAFTFGFWD